MGKRKLRFFVTKNYERKKYDVRSQPHTPSHEGSTTSSVNLTVSVPLSASQVLSGACRLCVFPTWGEVSSQSKNMSRPSRKILSAVSTKGGAHMTTPQLQNFIRIPRRSEWWTVFVGMSPQETAVVAWSWRPWKGKLAYSSSACSVMGCWKAKRWRRLHLENL